MEGGQYVEGWLGEPAGLLRCKGVGRGLIWVVVGGILRSLDLTAFAPYNWTAGFALPRSGDSAPAGLGAACDSG